MTATLEPTTTPQAGKPATATVVDVIRKARDAGVQVVNLRFTDLPGTWQHFSIPLKELTEDLFKEGIGFDGSSIRGFQAINESDMLLFPDPASAFVDPCLEVPTLSLTCDVSDPVTGARYSRDPRYVAQKAEQHLVKSGSPRRPTTGPKPSSTSSTRCASIRTRTKATITSTPRRGSGTRGRMAARIRDTGRGTRRATSRCRRSTGCRTCARRSCSR